MTKGCVGRMYFVKSFGQLFLKLMQIIIKKLFGYQRPRQTAHFLSVVPVKSFLSLLHSLIDFVTCLLPSAIYRGSALALRIKKIPLYDL